MKKQSYIPDNILVVRLGAMGDIVHVIPAVKNLRENYPSAHISWLVEDTLKDLIELIPEIDEVLVFPRRKWQAYLKQPKKYVKLLSEVKEFFTLLRRKRWEIALDFHGNFKSGLLTFLSGAQTRLGFSKGFCKEFNFVFTNLRIGLKQNRIHRIDKYLTLLQGLGIEASYQRPSFSVPDADKIYINDFFQHANLEQKRIVAIHPGTSLFGKYKRWPVKNYAILADRLVNELNYSVVFTWGSLEYPIVQEIVSSMRYHATIACKTSSVKQLIALLQRAQVFIGGDTGPTNIASSMGIPTIAIFGPKDPVIYAPYDKNASVVKKDIPCSPCVKRTCDHVTCITSVTPDDVLNAIHTLPAKEV